MRWDVPGSEANRGKCTWGGGNQLKIWKIVITGNILERVLESKCDFFWPACSVVALAATAALHSHPAADPIGGLHELLIGRVEGSGTSETFYDSYSLSKTPRVLIITFSPSQHQKNSQVHELKHSVNLKNLTFTMVPFHQKIHLKNYDNYNTMLLVLLEVLRVSTVALRFQIP